LDLQYVTDLRVDIFCVSFSRDATELRCRDCGSVARYFEGSEPEPQPPRPTPQL